MARPISLQLYTLREHSAQDFRGVLDRVGSIGYSGVEPAGLYGLSPREFRDVVEGHGMTVSSAHVGGRLTPDDTGRLLDEQLELGASIAVVPMLSPDRFADADGVKRMADIMNAAVEPARQRGLRLAYHNHHFEFLNRVDGRFAYDVFVEQLDPAVELEVDVYWAQTGGEDPAALVRRLGERVSLLHVKDGPCVASEAMQAVGDGKVDVPAVLAASERPEWHIVELDRYAGDMWDAVERSYAYLTGNGLSTGRR